MKGTTSEMLPGHLDEFMYREQNEKCSIALYNTSEISIFRHMFSKNLQKYANFLNFARGV